MQTTNRDFLLSIYLRGGADGLSFLPPYDDDNYKKDGGRSLRSLNSSPMAPMGCSAAMIRPHWRNRSRPLHKTRPLPPA